MHSHVRLHLTVTFVVSLITGGSSLAGTRISEQPEERSVLFCTASEPNGLVNYPRALIVTAHQATTY